MTEELLREADVLLGNLESPEQLEKTECLKWIQLNNAGTEGYCVPGRLPQGAVLTNATGAYGLAISEHMLACLFMLRKKLNLYYANQLQSQWKSGRACGRHPGNYGACDRTGRYRNLLRLPK